MGLLATEGRGEDHSFHKATGARAYGDVYGTAVSHGYVGMGMENSKGRVHDRATKSEGSALSTVKGAALPSEEDFEWDRERITKLGTDCRGAMDPRLST